VNILSRELCANLQRKAAARFDYERISVKGM
jgi:hypothetical protein